jgi:hypothetical protein
VPAAVPGEVAEQEIDSAMLEAATTLGRRAADRLNERTAEGVLEAGTGTPEPTGIAVDARSPSA